MMKTALRLFTKSLSSSSKTPLGRWNINNYRETSLKIKYANEDNCGVCCNNNNKESVNIIEKKDELDDNEYIYAMGYESVHN